MSCSKTRFAPVPSSLSLSMFRQESFASTSTFLPSKSPNIRLVDQGPTYPSPPDRLLCNPDNSAHTSESSSGPHPPKSSSPSPSHPLPASSEESPSALESPPPPR